MKKLFFKLLALANFLVPKKDSFLLLSYPVVEDQMVSMLRCMQEAGIRGERVTVLTSGEEAEARWALRQLVGAYADEVRMLPKDSIKGMWSYLRARNVLVTHGIYGFEPIPKRQRLINLWHGMPIKTIWGDLKGSEVPKCRYLLSTSALFSDILQKASGLPMEKIRVTGLPRNDLLLEPSDKAKLFGEEMKKDSDFLVFFLPTYRKSRVGFMTLDGEESGSALAMNEEELKRLGELAEKLRIKILVKPHPMSSHYGKVQAITERILLITDKWLHERSVSLYEALSQSDMLISDTSSVYVDYLVLNRPALCYFPDLAAYRSTRKFLLEPMEDWFAEPVCEDGLTLCRQMEQIFVNGDTMKERRTQICRQLNPMENYPSAPKVLALMKK